MNAFDAPSTHPSLLHALGTPEHREEAWRTFFQRYEPVISRWCRRWGVQSGNAEEVSATVVAKLFENLRNYEPGKGKFRPWLKAVVHNAVRDYLRHLRRHPDHQGAGGSDAQSRLAGIEAPEAADALAHEIDERLEHALRQAVEAVRTRVTEQTWQAFWLRSYEGQPTAEVAELLSMSRAAVSQAVYRVGTMIRQEYDRHHDTPKAAAAAPSGNT
jgi:RNA polymerase sigma-70 factor (ECF subfamily)